MYTYISLLRGINVSGQKMIRMVDLKEVYVSLHLAKVTTYLQSGNVVFDCGEPDAAKIAKSIEAALARSFGYSVSVLIRDRDELLRIRASNPFINQRHEDPVRLYVTFLSEAPTAVTLNKLKVPEGRKDEFMVSGREIYLFCPGGYGRTKLSNTFFEKKLGLVATTRNWKTVGALGEMIG